MLPTITGEFRAVDDSTLRFTPSGMAVAEFRAAANSRKFNEETKQWEDDKVVWLSVVCFKKLAETVAETVTKGKLVTVTGRLQTDSWEKDGEKRQKYVVIADQVGLSIAFQPAKWISPDRAEGTGSSGGDPWAGGGGSSSDDPPF